MQSTAWICSFVRHAGAMHLQYDDIAAQFELEKHCSRVTRLYTRGCGMLPLTCHESQSEAFTADNIPENGCDAYGWPLRLHSLQ